MFIAEHKKKAEKTNKVTKKIKRENKAERMNIKVRKIRRKRGKDK